MRDQEGPYKLHEEPLKLNPRLCELPPQPRANSRTCGFCSLSAYGRCTLSRVGTSRRRLTSREDISPLLGQWRDLYPATSVRPYTNRLKCKPGPLTPPWSGTRTAEHLALSLPTRLLRLQPFHLLYNAAVLLDELRY